MSSITDLSAVELAAAIAKGETTSLEATKAYLDAIAARDGDFFKVPKVIPDSS